VAISRFPVEAGQIFQFARAIGDLNRVYCDPEAAAAGPTGGIIAPPTFVEAGQHFDPDFPYRPEPGRPWFGSAAGPSGAQPPVAAGRTALHAETHLRFHRNLRPGDVLHTRETLGDTWTKTGRRGGLLTFQERLREYLDADDQVVVEMRLVSVITEHVVDAE
jgi:acyl dehydratase